MSSTALNFNTSNANDAMSVIARAERVAAPPEPSDVRPTPTSAMKADTNIWSRLARATPSEILSAMRLESGWTAEKLGLVDGALGFWVDRTLAMPIAQSQASCIALFDLIGALRSLFGEAEIEALDPHILSGWSKLEYLLDRRAKRADSIASELADEAFWSSKHVLPALTALRDAESMTQSELKTQLALKNDASISQLVARLETVGLIDVSRTPGDARSRTLRLSPLGNSEFEKRAPRKLSVDRGRIEYYRSLGVPFLFDLQVSPQIDVGRTNRSELDPVNDGFDFSLCRAA